MDYFGIPASSVQSERENSRAKSAKESPFWGICSSNTVFEIMDVFERNQTVVNFVPQCNVLDDG